MPVVGFDATACGAIQTARPGKVASVPRLRHNRPLRAYGLEAAMHKVVLSTGNIIFSLVLGAIALAFVGINYPETLDQIINLATSVKGYIVNTNLPPKYNVWVRLLLEEKQLVFMFFTILMRILLAILQSIATGFWGRTHPA
jgi:hypothetical protein